MELKDNGEKMQKNFDEGFDNILVFDFDKEYQEGAIINSNSLMSIRRTNVESLNGKWNFSPDVFYSVVRSRWFEETKQNRNGMPIPYDFSFDEWDVVDVPGVWNNQRKEFALYEGIGLYFREFSYSPQKDNRVYLRFNGANYETRIWFNKCYLGRHLGGFTPFCVDITEVLQDSNRLLVAVDNTRRAEQIPSFHYDWFNYGGLHRGVEIVEVPKAHIKNTYIQLSKKEENQFVYEVTVCGEAQEQGIAKSIPVIVKIKELGVHKEIFCEQTGEAGLYIGKGTLHIEENLIQKWSPSEPKLYEVEWGIEKDWLIDTIGFRRIEVEKQNIMLNGEKIFLKGMCVHEESQASLRAVTDSEITEMIVTAKELGCNFLRLTHYPHSDSVARIADELGMLLLEEIPVYWAIEFWNPATFKDAKNQLKELIFRDRNRASVIIWSVGNENPDSDVRYNFMKGLVETARELDSERLIGASCLIDVDECKIKDRLIELLDVVGINEYYGWYLKDFETLEAILSNYRTEKPLIITETGADAVCGLHSEKEEIYSEECQAAIYKKQFEVLLKYPFIQGITPWILFDYLSMRRMSILQNGYNLKGIIGADRKHKKLAYNVVYEVYHRGSNI